MGVDRDMLRQLLHLLRPLSTRIANIAAKGVVYLAEDARKLQMLQLGVHATETVPDCEHHQPYGFSSVPLGGAEAIVLFQNGDRERPLVVAVSDRRYRPTGGQGGEVTVYNHTGAKIVLTKDGDIVATPATGRNVLVNDGAGGAELALKSDLAKIETAIAGATITPGDGGATLKTTISAGLATSLHGASGGDTWPIGTTVLKAK